MPTASEFVIVDPYNEYGTHIIEHIHRKYSHRAICLYSVPGTRSLGERRTSSQVSSCIAANYDLLPGRIEELSTELRARHEVIAVVPFDETSLLPLIDLAPRLGLEWPKPQVMARFRDKFALKQHLRETAPDIRINASRIVSSTRDVLSLRLETPYENFILKPNDGYGNRHIGLFGRGTPEKEINDYFARNGHSTILMEEFIGGTEYFVNGQVDARGNVFVLAIFQYIRGIINGRHNIDLDTIQVHAGTRKFDGLGDYASQVISATGLVRSPFHLELKIDERGPCLIEVAARLPGHGNAWLTGELHGPQFDIIDLATHYYLRTTDYGPPPVNWTTYNAQSVRYVHGFAHRRERIYDLEGVAEVEALPEFYCWISRPVVGSAVARTIDCLSMPWSLILRAPTPLKAATAAAKVRGLIHWNRCASTRERAALGLKFAVQKGPAYLRRELMITASKAHAALQRAAIVRSLRRH